MAQPKNTKKTTQPKQDATPAQAQTPAPDATPAVNTTVDQPATQDGGQTQAPAQDQAPAPAQDGGSKKKRKAPAKKPAKKAGKKDASKKKPVKKAAKAKAAPVKADSGVVDDDNQKPGSRYFKLVYDGKVSGRFSGNKPKQAANKALTAIIKGITDGSAVDKEMKFRIKECTRGSKHKEYCYVGERIKLDKPMEVTIGKGAEAKKIVYKFTNKVKKSKEEAVATA